MNICDSSLYFMPLLPLIFPPSVLFALPFLPIFLHSSLPATRFSSTSGYEASFGPLGHLSNDLQLEHLQSSFRPCLWISLHLPCLDILLAEFTMLLLPIPQHTFLAAIGLGKTLLAPQKIPRLDQINWFWNQIIAFTCVFSLSPWSSSHTLTTPAWHG